jgi:hypothetical protein
MGRLCKTALGMIYLVVFSSIFYACQLISPNRNEIQNQVLLGNWYYCSDSLGYSEVYFINESEVVFYDLISGSEYLNYKVLGDSLILFSDYFVFSFKFSKPNRDIILFRSYDDLNMTFNRLEDDIRIDMLLDAFEGDYDTFREGFWVRSQGQCSSP